MWDLEEYGKGLFSLQNLFLNSNHLDDCLQWCHGVSMKERGDFYMIFWKGKLSLRIVQT